MGGDVMPGAEPRPVPAGTNPVLELDRVGVHFRSGAGTVQAVNGVSLTVGPGEVVGLVGESGSGKSTLARAAVGLVKPAFGTVRIQGQDITRLRGGRMRAVRRRVHMVFQDASSAMNPRMSVGDVVGEPLRQHRLADRRERRDRVVRMLERVGLRPDYAERMPHEISGGQRQRVGIARALILGPDLLVADEPVSALDVSIQAAILNLLSDLQSELGFGCLFISHDLSVVEHVSDRIAVMYLGRIVEQGSRAQLFQRPEHPYSQALVSAAPYPDPARQRSRVSIVLGGEVPSPLDPPAGCAFHTRCPLAVPECRDAVPRMEPVGTDGHEGHEVRCVRHRPAEGVPRLQEVD